MAHWKLDWFSMSGQFFRDLRSFTSEIVPLADNLIKTSLVDDLFAIKHTYVPLAGEPLKGSLDVAKEFHGPEFKEFIDSRVHELFFGGAYPDCVDTLCDSMATVLLSHAIDTRLEPIIKSITPGTSFQTIFEDTTEGLVYSEYLPRWLEIPSRIDNLHDALKLL